jgi:hypothetical protein
VGRQDIGGGGNVAGERANIYYFHSICKSVVDETYIDLSSLYVHYIITVATRLTVAVRKRVKSDHGGGVEKPSSLCSNILSLHCVLY